MRRILTLTVVALMVATAFSASAFTTGYVDRTATIDVVADGNGLIQLNDGTSGDLVGISNDELTIDFSNSSGATGANQNASFTLGDPADANNASAFNISSSAAEQKKLTLNYTLSNTDPDDTTDNVNFTIYTSTGTKQVSATENSPATYSLGSNETVYVVITVDTTNVSASANEVLDGTLRIKLA